MTKVLDTSFLDRASPADRGIRLHIAADDATLILADIDVGEPGQKGSGTIRIRLGCDDAKKLAARLYAIAALAAGDPIGPQGPAN